MCGIVFTKGYNEGNSRKALELIKHRGPDAIGDSYINGDYFGHVRLSILDLDSRSNQPFRDNENNLLIFNGEIFNFLEIRAKLITRLGIKFKTSSDTEVLFVLLKYGCYDLLNELNGFWAFVFRNARGEIFVCRDRFGIKPLFYKKGSRSLVIASECRAIRYLSPSSFNREVVVNFLVRPSSVNGVNSFYEDIYDVPCGMFFQIKGCDLECLFEIKTRVRKGELKSEIDNAVLQRSKCDVDYGLALSSGLDSNIIANILYHNDRDKSHNAFTVKSEDYDDYEYKIASKVCDKYGWNHSEVVLDKTTFIDDLTKAVKALDRPHSSFAITSVWKMYERVSSQGIKVLLEGQGADERFGGYRNHTLTEEFIRLLKGMKFLQAYRFRVASSIQVKHIMRELLNGSKMLFTLSYLYIMRQFLSINFIGYARILRISNFNVDDNLKNLLFYADHLSMNHSVETRNPFMDDIFYNEVPTSQDGFTKVALRNSFSHMESDTGLNLVWNKEKLGFRSPICELLVYHKEDVLKLWESFRSRGVLPIRRLSSIEEKLGEEKARLIYRVISTELWMRKEF